MQINGLHWCYIIMFYFGILITDPLMCKKLDEVQPQLQFSGSIY